MFNEDFDADVSLMDTEDIDDPSINYVSYGGNVKLNRKSIEEKPFYKAVSFYVILGLICLTLIFTCFFQVVVVSGESMEPTLSDGNILIASKHFSLDRFDIVTIHTNDQNKSIIKRVIGLPGETVEYKDNKLYIDNILIVDTYGCGETTDFKVTLNNNEYYCLGDNREHSRDSRSYGPFTMDSIFGKITRR